MTDEHGEVMFEPFSSGLFSISDDRKRISGSFPLSEGMNYWKMVSAEVDESGIFLNIEWELRNES